MEQKQKQIEKEIEEVKDNKELVISRDQEKTTSKRYRNRNKSFNYNSK